MIVAKVIRAVDIARGVLLDADLIIRAVGVEIVDRGDRGVFLDDDGLDAGCVARGEVDRLLALFGDGETCHCEVCLAAGDSAENRAEFDVHDFQLVAELFADRGRNIDVDAGGLLVLIELIRREGNVRCHRERLLLAGGFGGRGFGRSACAVLLGCAGGKGTDHQDAEHQSNQLFHILFLHKNRGCF